MSQQNAPIDPQLQQLRRLRQLTMLGLVMGALVLLLVAFALMARSIQSEVTQAEATLMTVQAELLQRQTPAPAMLSLMATLTQTRALAAQIRAAAPPASIHWPQMIAALERYDPNVIALRSLTQVEQQITLTGQAANDEAVVAYTQAIEATEHFATVVLQSLSRIPPSVATAGTGGEATDSAIQATDPPFLDSPSLVEFVIIVELSE